MHLARMLQRRITVNLCTLCISHEITAADLIVENLLFFDVTPAPIIEKSSPYLSVSMMAHPMDSASTADRLHSSAT
jgi:hypothetical protein